MEQHVMDVKLPNGTIIRGVPEGTSKEDVMKKAIASGLAKPEDFGMQPQASEQPQQAVQPQERSFLDKAAGIGETALTMATGAIAEPLAGLAGLASAPFVGADAGSVVENVRSAATYQPRTQAGNEYLKNVAEAPILSDIAQAMQSGQQKLGSAAYEATGSPALAAAAETIPTLLTMGAGKLASKAVEPAFRISKGDSSLPENAQSALNYADNEGLILPTSDVLQPKTALGIQAQSAAEKIPLTGTGAMRADQQAQRIEQIKKLSEQYGTPSDDEIVASINRSTNKVKGAAGKRYEQIISDMGAQPIELKQTVLAIDDALNQYAKPGALKNEKVLGSLQQIKDQLLSGENDLQLLRQNRTLFRELIKGEDTALPESAKRINDRVYQAMTNDMVDGVSTKLGPDTARKMREADAIYADEINSIKKTKLKSILEKGDVKPELATRMLFSTDRSEFKGLYDSLDIKGRENARAAIVSRMFEKFDTTESPEKFLSEAAKIKPQIGVFFKGEERKQLDGLINWLDSTRQATKASTVTSTGQQNFQVLAPSAVVGDIYTTGGIGVATVGSLGALAKVYESKPVRSIMIRMASTPKNSPEFKRLSNELSVILASYTQSEAEKNGNNL
jgi:hypothetical protein